MSVGIAFWLIIFVVSSLLFFGVAGVVAARGWGDLRDLLHRLLGPERRTQNTG